MNKTTKGLRPLALGLIVASTCVPAFAWGDGIGDRMGLPEDPDGTIEVRIWIDGTVIPWDLYTIRKHSDGVVGEHYLWLERPTEAGPDADKFDRMAIRDNRKLMRQNCGKSLRSSSGLMWCLTSTNVETNWAHVLDALPIAELWELPPQQSLGAPPCSLFDGVDVHVELRSGEKEHSARYSNPGECCPWPECAVAAKVLSVVGALR